MVMCSHCALGGSPRQPCRSFLGFCLHTYVLRDDTKHTTDTLSLFSALGQERSIHGLYTRGKGAWCRLCFYSLVLASKEVD